MFMCDMSEESILAKITTLILAKNEERNIVDCIKTVQFTDEILVIDDFSTDRTKSLAESMGARVIQHAMNGDWEDNKLSPYKMLSVSGFCSSMPMNVFLNR